MNSPLQRLYQTKLALLATVSTVVGLALLICSRWLVSRPGWIWFAGLVNDVGASLFSIGLLGIFFQYVGAADQQQEDDDRVRRMLKETAPDIRDAVVEGFAFAPDSLTSVASPATLNRIIENCLAIQLGDHALAREASAGLQEQLDQARPRLDDTHVSVVLSPWAQGPAHGKGSMFAATIRWEYRLVPNQALVRFACVSDVNEYHELLADPSYAIVWYLQPTGELTGASAEAFQLLKFAVDGKELNARRSVRGKTQILTVDLGQATVAEDQAVTLAYTYRTLVQKNGHLLHLDISQPTKGLHVEFSYADCGIRHVNILDYVAGTRRPRITQLPPSDSTPSVEVSFDGWVLPKGGVAFVWVLESELEGQ